MDVEKSQKWFAELWNDTIVPYLSQINKEFTVRVCVHSMQCLLYINYLRSIVYVAENLCAFL